MTADNELFTPTDLAGLTTPEGRTLADVKLIASDMDRTLLDDDGELPAGFGELIERLHDEGIYFVAASGRPVYTLRNMFRNYLDRVVLMGDNGGLIMLGDQVLYKSAMPTEVYRRLARYVHETAGSGNVCGYDAAYIEKRDEALEPNYRTFYHEIKFVDDLEQLDVPANKFTIFFIDNSAPEHFEKLKETGLVDGLSAATSGPMWIDVMMPGVNKGEGLRHVGEALGIGVEDMMAFGDTFNDKEMLATAGFGFMVANATPGMEAYARYVAPANTEAGVVAVAERVLAEKAGAR